MQNDPKDLLGEPLSEVEALQDGYEFVWDLMQEVSRENVELRAKVAFLKKQLRTVYGPLALENRDLHATIERIVRRDNKNYG